MIKNRRHSRCISSSTFFFFSRITIIIISRATQSRQRLVFTNNIQLCELRLYKKRLRAIGWSIILSVNKRSGLFFSSAEDKKTLRPQIELKSALDNLHSLRKSRTIKSIKREVEKLPWPVDMMWRRKGGEIPWNNKENYYFLNASLTRSKWASILNKFEEQLSQSN